jgi:hypothetical protein
LVNGKKRMLHKAPPHNLNQTLGQRDLSWETLIYNIIFYICVPHIHFV